MASSTTPDFQWGAIYYPNLLAALKQVKSREWPEHTETDSHDPVNNLLALMALVGHLQACRLDHAARETYPATARLRQSFFGPANLLSYTLAPPIPAEADVLADISGALSGSTLLLRAHSLCGTSGTSQTTPLVFEYVEDTDLYAGPTGVWTMIQDDGGVKTAYTSGTLWGGTPAVGDALYIGHAGLMWNKVKLSLGTGATNITAMRWEYYDDLREGAPDTVIIDGSTLVFAVGTVVGTTNATGLSVKVTCLSTGLSETLNVAYNSSTNKITTASYLGQTSPSTNPADYTVETNWPELPGLSDGSTRMSSTGEVSWTLPQTTDRRWASSSVSNGTADVAGFWLRARVTAVSSPTSPLLSSLAEPSRTTWTLMWHVYQGQRVEDTIGTTDEGTASQTFSLNSSPLIEFLSLTVGGVEWARVKNLLTSASYESVYTLKEQADGTWQIEFGDGSNGAIPGALQTVKATYRYGADKSGNVGASEIKQDRSGNGRLTNIRNPRAASGWVVQEGTTDKSLAELRVALPASIRTLERVVTPTDAETMAVAFRQTDGSQTIIRALAIEEGAGAKTLKLICVGYGNVAPTTEELTELDTYFNGELVGVQRIGGLVMGNTQVVSAAFVPHSIDVTATVDVLSEYATSAKAAIEAALNATLQPTAKRVKLNADGSTSETTSYQWRWNGKVTSAAINTSITLATVGVIDISLSGWVDVTLDTAELPVPGTITITVNSVTA